MCVVVCGLQRYGLIEVSMLGCSEVRCGLVGQGMLWLREMWHGMEGCAVGWDVSESGAIHVPVMCLNQRDAVWNVLRC